MRMHRMLCGKKVAVYGPELIDHKAMKQLLACMLPDWAMQGAAMPDMHYGFTMPIGGVIKTNGMAVPSWVGYDIGCGVCYVETTFHHLPLRAMKYEIYDAVKAAIPSGFKHHTGERGNFYPTNPTSPWFIDNYLTRGGDRQLGTLGSGNHFIEIGLNSDNKVCFVIHSGSRGIGHNTATHYIKMAHPKGKCVEGSYPLDLTTQAGSDYISDMSACLEFALENRRQMLIQIQRLLRDLGLQGNIITDSLINKTHNHAEVTENGHVIHRKGATDSGRGVLGVIPGQSKVGSYIVRGRGAADAMCSSSHGAGRTGSRTEAKLGKKDEFGVHDSSTALSMEKFADDMDGIVAYVGPETLDEAPEAYKDPGLVMAAQTDLVEVVDHVTPVVCIKDVKQKHFHPKKKGALSNA